MILKISLEPLSPYYFGGENKFNEGGEVDGDRRSTYLLHSNPFPQQTGILGMLRNQLLLQNGLLANNNEKVQDCKKAASLIGEKSFKLAGKNDFGVLEQVGMVFMRDADGNAWYPAPLDDVKMKKPEEDEDKD